MNRELTTTVLDVVALGLVITGVWLIFVPAALIVAGGGVLAVSWKATR